MDEEKIQKNHDKINDITLQKSQNRRRVYIFFLEKYIMKRFLKKFSKKV